MKTRSRNFNHYGVLTSLSVALVTCLIGMTGAFRAFDDIANDLLYKLGPENSNSNMVLLVPAPASSFSDPECRQLKDLASELASFEPLKIGILFEPTDQQLRQLEQLPVAEKIVVGNRIRSSDKDQTEPKTLAASSTSRTQGSVIEQGFLNLKMDQNVYREHFSTRSVAGTAVSSFVRVIASCAIGPESLPTGSFGIRYVGGVNALPHVDADEVRGKNIISEMIQNKIVLIGPEPVEDFGLITPTTVNQRMSLLELHGNALHTLLTDNFLVNAGEPVAIVILACVAFIGCQFFRQMPSRFLIATFGYGLLAVTVVGWLTLHGLSIKLPLSSFYFALSIVMLSTVRSRFQTIKDLIESWQLMRQTGSQSDWKAEEKDTWTLVSDSVYQIICPNRMVLMELLPGATHLSVTKTIQCTEKDILERRRDFNREPYREAVELGAAMKIQNRQFFKINEETECLEYIAPLIILSELVGFMVLEMTCESVKNWDDFENFLSQFSNDMAVLVNKYRIMQQQESRKSNLIEKLKELPEENRKRSLFQSEVEHHNLENLLGDAFETIQTAGVICDVFGRVIRTNLKMVEVLQGNGIAVDDTDCISLLASLTGWNKNDCRKLFRQCVVEGRNQQIFLPEQNNQSAPRVLYLEPLSKGEDEPEISSRCVCIQIVEGRIFEESRHWQNEFSQDNLDQIACQLNSLRELTVRLQLGHLDHPSRLDEGAASQILQSVAECQSLLNSRFCEDPVNIVMFNAETVWKSCWQRLRPKMEARCIKTLPRFDAPRHEVAANPFLLDRIFETLLDCITHDIAEEAEIVISTDAFDNKLVFRFADVSGGQPIEDLRRSLDIESAEGPDQQDLMHSVLTPLQVDKLREINSWLVPWNASLTIQCAENYRISFELILETELSQEHRSRCRTTQVSTLSSTSPSLQSTE